MHPRCTTTTSTSMVRISGAEIRYNQTLLSNKHYATDKDVLKEQVQNYVDNHYYQNQLRFQPITPRNIYNQE